LTDGYAYDAKAKTYCKGPPELYEYQKKTTYMDSYHKLISIAKKVSHLCPEIPFKVFISPLSQFPDDEWKKMYDEHFPRVNKKNHLPSADRYFEKKDLCGVCQKEYNPEYPFHDHMVLNCRH
jgi:hypothetical protein